MYQFVLKKFPKLLYSTILKNKKYDIEFAAIHGFRDEILHSPLKNSKKSSGFIMIYAKPTFITTPTTKSESFSVLIKFWSFPSKFKKILNHSRRMRMKRAGLSAFIIHWIQRKFLERAKNQESRAETNNQKPATGNQSLFR